VQTPALTFTPTATAALFGVRKKNVAVFTFGSSGSALTAHGSLDLKQKIQIQIQIQTNLCSLPGLDGIVSV
jgi:hypothetical protein